jgi:hypothetical protein
VLHKFNAVQISLYVTVGAETSEYNIYIHPRLLKMHFTITKYLV